MVAMEWVRAVLVVVMVVTVVVTVIEVGAASQTDHGLI